MLHLSLQAARREKQKRLAVLVDPDKTDPDNLRLLAQRAEAGLIDYFLWGGSLVNEPQAEYYLTLLKSATKVPVYLFPGSIYQLSPRADGILLLSLLSGRNPDLLIGQQVLAAGRIKQMQLPVTATAYLLIDGGAPTSVSYMSNTTPIPANKPDIAACTALAGEQLGMQMAYLDAGSGARYPISAKMITTVRREVDIPLVVGGGIRDGESARAALSAGADLIVVGNALEKDLDLLPKLSAVVRSFSPLSESAI